MIRSRLILAFAVFAMCGSATSRAQLTLSNTANLTVTLAGGNIHLRADFDTTNGAFTLVQGPRPDALRLPPHSFQISNQIVDLGWVPPARTAQWTLTNAPASPARFFRLELEPILTRGRALVFKDGWIDFAAMKAQYGTITNFFTNGLFYVTPAVLKQPEEMWLDRLGTYDTNGVLIGPNEGMLTGFYGKTRINTLRHFHPQYANLPDVPRFQSPTNDFRVDFTGTANGLPRESIIWASEAMFYWAINDYRTRFLNDAFIDELNLPTELAKNLKERQYRPDLNTPTNEFSSPIDRIRPVFAVEEMPGPDFPFRFSPQQNAYGVALRDRAVGENVTDTPLSLMFDAASTVADYAGLAAFWLFGTNAGFPPDQGWGGSGWQNNILPPINDGISAWVAYRYSGGSEVYRSYYFTLRRWSRSPCGGTFVPCDKGAEVRNVMMHDESLLNGDGVFPYTLYPAGISKYQGPLGSDWAAFFFAAIFYDMANEAGLGVHKADLIFWKTLSVTTNYQPYNMRQFGSNVLQAVRALWPDGRYTNDVADVLTSRGIPLNGVANFRSNLPPVIGDSGTLVVPSVNGFGSAHPESQPSSTSGNYGAHILSTNGYTYPETNAAYVAYQFYKHSKYGPCDKLALTDGTFTITNVGAFNWSYNHDGTFYVELTDRELGNLTVLAPGRRIRWMRSRQRCPNEATGYYVEDQRPFGFRVIQATSEGFSFTAAALGETPTNKTYALTIVDPSLATLGPAAYSWTVTNHLGTATSQTGTTAQFTVAKDEPFTLHIARTRAGITNTLTLRERGNDLDRNGGQAFVRNLVP